MTRITAGHPQTMLLALALFGELTQQPSAVQQWRLMLSLDDGHTARAMHHARSLHRLGGFVLQRIARGLGPYEGSTSDVERNERGRAARRLHAAGLIRSLDREPGRSPIRFSPDACAVSYRLPPPNRQ